jgi:hypothetical protein
MGDDGKPLRTVYAGQWVRRTDPLVELHRPEPDLERADALLALETMNDAYLAIEQSRARLGQRWLGDFHTHDAEVPNASMQTTATTGRRLTR